SNFVAFTVTVSECVRVGIGRTVLQVGHNACVTVNLLSTVALTNLSFILLHPADRFANWTLGVTNPATCNATVTNLDPTETFFNLGGDRKSTRLNSSHQIISYAVFCLKKKKKKQTN